MKENFGWREKEEKQRNFYLNNLLDVIFYIYIYIYVVAKSFDIEENINKKRKKKKVLNSSKENA